MLCSQVSESDDNIYFMKTAVSVTYWGGGGRGGSLLTLEYCITALL